jgi:hypothetical protein
LIRYLLCPAGSAVSGQAALNALKGDEAASSCCSFKLCIGEGSSEVWSFFGWLI